MKKLYLLGVLVVGMIFAVAIMRWCRSVPNPSGSITVSGDRTIPAQVSVITKSTQAVGVAISRSPAGQYSVTRSNAPPMAVHQNSAQGVNGAKFNWNGSTLSPQVELAVGIRKSKSQEERWIAIHGLGKTLSPDEINALFQYLEDKAVGSLDEDIRGQKNDILSALIDQEPQPAQLQGKLLSMFRDKTHEEWWRNFCVQHFELLYRKKWPNNSTGGGDEERRAMKDAYSEAVREAGNSIAGTALLGLVRLSEDYPEFEKSSIMRDAVSIAANQGADQRSRIAALQVAGRLGCVDILPVARSVVASGAGVSFRMAAIATLGEVGKSEDKDVLRQIMTGSDPYLQKAATKALNCIELRVAGVNSKAEGR